jgi:hypothetical protein
LTGFLRLQPADYSSQSEVLNNPAKSMGHGFVLAMLLTDDAALKECEIR